MRAVSIRLDPAPLVAAAAGALAACAATLPLIGFRAAAAPLLSALFVGGALGFIAVEIRRHGVASPPLLVVLGLAYYHVMIPIEFLIDPTWPAGILRELPQLNERLLVLPLVATDLALAAFVVGCAVRREGPPLPPRPLDERRLTLGAAGYVAFGLSMYLAMSVIATGSLGGIFETTYRERDELFYGLGILGSGIFLVYIGLICLGVHWIASGERRRALLAIGLCAVMALHSFLVGSKMHAFQVGVGMLFGGAAALAGATAEKRRGARTAALGIVLVLLVPMLFVGLARNKQGQGLSAMAEFVDEEADADAVNPANIDAYGPYLTLVYTTMTLRVPEELQWGATYTQALTLLPPRFLYPGRPTPVDEQFSRAFLGKDYYDNAGFAYSAVTEAYVNFGLVGPVVMFLLAGLGFGALRDALARRRGSLGAALLFACAAPWLVIFVRYPLAGFVKSCGVTTMVPALLLWYFARPPRARAAVAAAYGSAT